MADLAIVFHWTPTDCADFSLRELMEWRERARQRSMNEAPHGAQPPPPGAARQRR